MKGTIHPAETARKREIKINDIHHLADAAALREKIKKKKKSLNTFELKRKNSLKPLVTHTCCLLTTKI